MPNGDARIIAVGGALVVFLAIRALVKILVVGAMARRLDRERGATLNPKTGEWLAYGVLAVAALMGVGMWLDAGLTFKVIGIVAILGWVFFATYPRGEH